MLARPFPFAIAVAIVTSTSSAQEVATKVAEKATATSNDEGAGALTLERIFPKDSPFGPAARSPAFSADGRYGAWLYRPPLERRHGSDLWVRDFETDETLRVTSCVAMEAFSRSAAEVAEDRREKAEKRKSERGEKERGDEVDEKDKDDEKAPRWGGVSSFTWSPDGDELLFLSGGDVFRYRVGHDIERLTRTRESERRVAYLPDGSGYTFQADDAVYRVRFGDHRVDQIDPRLPSGEELASYRLSPDGRRLALLSTKGQGRSEIGRKVSIASYRDRFMKVREVSRPLADDPVPERVTTLYLYEIPAPTEDRGDLVRVHSHKSTGVRDQLRTPDWAPDSSRVTFSLFIQESGHVELYEALCEPVERGGGDPERKENDKKGTDEKDTDKKSDKKDDVIERPARLVRRFLHEGGPTTPRMIEPFYLADSRRIVYLSEESGFRHLHVLDPVYGSVDQWTRGRFEVYPIDPPDDRRSVFVRSTREHPTRCDVYRVDLESGAMTRLSSEDGYYEDVAVSPDGARVLANFTCYGELKELVAIDVAAGTQEVLTESHGDEARAITAARPSFFEFENRHGQTVHGLMMEPDDDGVALRPLLVYVYGGPLGTRKQVREGNYGRDAYLFAQYMTQTHGYVTCTIDPRGMSGYGALFEKANYEQVGLPQVEDLTDGVRHLIAHHRVDPERVAIHGWSFGGFQTQMCLYTEPDVFSVGIAGAGPTEWENYNAWYSTATIGDSREGHPDLVKYSLLPMAEKLEGRLLLVHGMEDSNVLFQDTVRVYAELLEAGKEKLVDLFLDPTGGHGLGGKVKSVNRFRKYEEFLVLHNAGTAIASAVRPEEEEPLTEPIGAPTDE